MSLILISLIVFFEFIYIYIIFSFKLYTNLYCNIIYMYIG